MIKQRLDEWTMNYNDDFYNRQFITPYQTTIKYCDWLEHLDVLSGKSESNIIDLGTGKGANLYYMQQRFPNCRYLGIDINNDFVKEGNDFFEKIKTNRCTIEYGDIYNLDFKKYADRFEGVISFQTLLGLPEYEIALTEIIKLNTDWISFSSIFYDGLVDCKIELQEFNNPQDKNSYRTAFYNIYSLPRMENFLFEKGYKIFKYCPLVMDIDLPKPPHTHMQSYTQKLDNDKRILISGPLLMNWFFVYAAKI